MRGMGLVLAGCIALGMLGCVDVEGGDVGTYGSPCGSGFRDILLCGRESGGADPADTTPGGDTGGPATCASVCTLFADCGFFSPAEIVECTFECEGNPLPQSVLDCIENAGCNFQQVCFSDN